MNNDNKSSLIDDNKEKSDKDKILEWLYSRFNITK